MDKKIAKYLVFIFVIINICILPVNASVANTSKDRYDISSTFIKKEFKQPKPDDLEIEPLSSLCKDKNVKIIAKAAGYTLLITKIVVPIILMVGAIMNYTKAMTANDEKGIKDATTKFAKAGIAALLVFFLPTIINLVLSLAEDDKYETNNYVNCRKCIFEVKNCK